jgi:hypothetical protein
LSGSIGENPRMPSIPRQALVRHLPGPSPLTAELEKEVAGSIDHLALRQLVGDVKARGYSPSSAEQATLQRVLEMMQGGSAFELPVDELVTAAAPPRPNPIAIEVQQQPLTGHAQALQLLTADLEPRERFPAFRLIRELGPELTQAQANELFDAMKPLSGSSPTLVTSAMTGLAQHLGPERTWEALKIIRAADRTLFPRSRGCHTRTDDDIVACLRGLQLRAQGAALEELRFAASKMSSRSGGGHQTPL